MSSERGLRASVTSCAVLRALLGSTLTPPNYALLWAPSPPATSARGTRTGQRHRVRQVGGDSGQQVPDAVGAVTGEGPQRTVELAPAVVGYDHSGPQCLLASDATRVVVIDPWG